MLARMDAQRRAAVRGAEIRLRRGEVLAPAPREEYAPPASSWREAAMCRLMAVTMRADLSGCDRKVLDAIVLKVLCGRVGCVRGRVTVQSLAEAVERTEQAVRLSLKRLAGLGIVQLSFHRRELAGVQIHAAILNGSYSQIVDNSSTVSTAPSAKEKIFSPAVSSPPPKPPTTLSQLNPSVMPSRLEGEDGTIRNCRPLGTPTDAPQRARLAHGGDEGGKLLINDPATATAQGIQQRESVKCKAIASGKICCCPEVQHLGICCGGKPAGSRRDSG